ncbi:MAG: HAD-IA family hydrolase, partial [Ginsengibacter sp.]
GLTPYFKHIITSEISNSVKPKKEIFDFAIKQANGKMAECIMIGDNQEADVAGAQSAGMDAIFVNHINAVCSKNPKYTICHLKELENIF